MAALLRQRRRRRRRADRPPAGSGHRFSSSKLFTKTRDGIVYFNQSLNGLSEGAPVKYRGVTVGSVKRVMVKFNQHPDDFAMPVIFEVDKALMQERVGDEFGEFFTD